MKIAFVFLLLITSFTHAEKTALEAANDAAFKSFDTKESLKGGDIEAKAIDIKNKVRSFIESGVYDGQLNRAKEIRTDLIDKRGEPALAGTPQEAIDRIKAPGQTYIFVSKSMPDGELRQFFNSLNGLKVENVEVAFRGMFEGNKTIPDFMKEIGLMVRDFGLKETSVSIGMNPVAFREYAITKVPTMIYTHEDGTHSIINGSINISYFLKSIGNTGQEIPSNGHQYKIAEKDFFLEIQERLAKIDFDSQMVNAKKKYWDSVGKNNIPQSVIFEQYDVDMTVEVSKDIVASDGKSERVIAREGQRFNPLNQPMMAAFNRSLIIFDPNSLPQLEWAKDRVKEALSENLKPVVMITRLIDSSKENSFAELEQLLRQQIFIAPDLILERFEIKSLPSLIEKSPVKGSMRVSVFACDFVTCGGSNE